MTKLIDLSAPEFKGQFGKLEVLRRFDSSKNRVTRWLCRCECGNETVVQTNNLRNGNTKSCAKGFCNSMSENLAGRKYGRLEVVELGGKSKWGARLWLCKCLGPEEFPHKKPKMLTTLVSSANLISGHTTSCGCLNEEVNQKRCTKYELTREIQKEYGSISKAVRKANSRSKVKISANTMYGIASGKQKCAKTFNVVKVNILGDATPESKYRRRPHLCDFCQSKFVEPEPTVARIAKRNANPQDCPILCSTECAQKWFAGETRKLESEPWTGFDRAAPKPERRINPETKAIAEIVKRSSAK